MKQKELAIVIPVYNSEKYLRECLDAFNNQTCNLFHVIAINDGSIDESRNILEEYQASYSWIEVYHQKNKGTSAARNFGLRIVESNSRFEFVAFVDSDDIVSNRYVETIFRYLFDSDLEYGVFASMQFDKRGIPSIKYSYSGISIIDQNQIISTIWGKEGDNLINNLYLGNKVFRLSAVKGSRFSTRLKYGEDHEWISQCLANLTKGIIIYDVLHFYRLRKSSVCHANIEENLKSNLKLYSQMYFEKGESFPALSPHLRRLFFDCWWVELKRCFLLNKHQKNRLSVDEIIQKFHFKDLDWKIKKRLFLYKCGDVVLNIYFNFSKKRLGKKKRNEFFFD